MLKFNKWKNHNTLSCNLNTWINLIKRKKDKMFIEQSFRFKEKLQRW